MRMFLSHENVVVRSVYNLITSCPGRVVDILEACGAFDPGSNPGRGVQKSSIDSTPIFFSSILKCYLIIPIARATRTISTISEIVTWQIIVIFARFWSTSVSVGPTVLGVWKDKKG